MDGSAKYTGADGHRKCTDILLIGKTGNGKSSTGNSILGRRVFSALTSSTSVTKSAQIEYSDLGDRIVKVVDIPGMYDTDSSPTHALELVINAAQYAVAANPRGYQAILLVVRIGTFTKEDLKTVQKLKSIFGSDFVQRFTIIVITHGDNFDPEENKVKTFEEWCQKNKGVFKELLTECRDRKILFDNRTKDEVKLNDQRQLLLTMIDSLNENGEPYCDKHFQNAKAGRDKILVKTKLPFIREESVMEASLIIQQLEKIKIDEPEQQLDRLTVVKRRADCLVKSIIEQDHGTGVLKDVIENAKNIGVEIGGQITIINKAVEIQAQRLKLTQNVKELDVAAKLCPQQSEEDAKQGVQINITNDAVEMQGQIMQRTTITEQVNVDPERNRSQSKEEREQQLQAQTENIKRQIDLNEAYTNAIEELRLSNERAKQEYNQIAERQNDNLLSGVIRKMSNSFSQFVKTIFSW